MPGSEGRFDPSPRRRTRRWPLIALAAIAAVALTHHARSAKDVLAGLLSGAPRPAIPFEVAVESSRFEKVRPEGAAAGLAVGDEPVRIGGGVYLGTASPWEAARRLRPGDTMEVVYRHSDPGMAPVEHTATIRLTAASPSRGSLVRSWIVGLGLKVGMPLFATLLGLWVVAVRPTDRRAWILLGLMLSFGQLVRADAASWEPGLREAGVAYSVALSSSWSIFMFLFGLSFPEPFRAEQRRPWIKWVPIAVIGASSLLTTVGSVGALEHQGAMGSVWAVERVLQVPAFVLALACVSSFFASLAMKTAFASSPDSKRRLRLLRTGATVALTPLFLLVIWSLATRHALEDAPTAIFLTALLPVLVFPATLAYVIVVQRALEVRWVLRMGARYLMVKNGLRLLIFAGMLPLGVMFSRIWLRPEVGFPLKLATMGVWVVIIFTVRRRATKALRAIDRRFFRDAYDEEHVLTELGEQVRTIVEAGPLLRTVTERIGSALHVGRIGTLVEDKGAFVLTPAPAAEPVPSLAAGSRTLEVLKAVGGPVGVYFDDPASWVHRDGGLPVAERRVLRELDTQILLPLAARGELLGMVSLGPKLSEQPYSRTDLRLLRNVATHTGLALLNSRLTSAIVAETATRARLSREIEIAREVQERLFPQQIPAVPGIECAGACRPASRVGGDYYDFLALPGGVLGIGLGDVSGKGIPAALLMASLQASLRGQTMDGGGDLARLMGRVNRLIHDTSPENRYATFFYAQLDPATRRLDYVNAGHNPPFLLRGGGAEILRLKDGGMVVGLMQDAAYVKASVDLRPGDLFVGFTDGISEAMNAEDEEWGEGRLLEALRSAEPGLAAPRVVERIFERADAFVAAAPQHDDMTLIVVRVLPG
ncbi:MAG: SpoIIE family protein phosphatase [Acidobacteriia bacterium]|nr:SpoIIE family protein phosphatase [Terriglobia bacterium]